MTVLARAARRATPHLRARLYWRTADREKPVLRRCIERLLATGATAVDVGAGVGRFTWLLARCVGRSGRVVAVEPNPVNLGPLRTLALTAPVTVVPQALSSCAGVRALHVPVIAGRSMWGLGRLDDGGGYGMVRRVSVLTATLDAVSAGMSPSFVKCDVEGHEDEVFRGGGGVLDSCRPTVLVEVEQRHRRAPVTDLFDDFASRAYLGFGVWPASLRPIARFSPEEHQDRTGWHDPASAPQGYIGDFLFVPTERAGALAGLVQT
jgi:FkbM family methyltransferase